jgi:hypothetical protein
MPLRNVSISRPCEVVVSAHASPRERNPALRSVMAARVFNRWLGRSRQAVEPVNHQHVTGFELVEHTAELAAVGFGSARHFAEPVLASNLRQLSHLRVNTLAVGGYPRVAVFHDEGRLPGLGNESVGSNASADCNSAATL